MALYRAFKAFRPEKSKQALIPALPYDVMNSEEILKILKKQAHLFKMKNLVFIFTGKL